MEHNQEEAKNCLRIKPTKPKGKVSITGVFMERFLSKWTEDVNDHDNRRAAMIVRHWAKPLETSLFFFFLQYFLL